MAALAKPCYPTEFTALAGTVTAIVPAPGVRSIWVSSPKPLYLCFGVADGAAVPPTARFFVPANTPWLIPFGGPPPGVASVGGSAAVTILAQP